MQIGAVVWGVVILTYTRKLVYAALSIWVTINTKPAYGRFWLIPLPYTNDAPRGIVVVDCTTHAWFVTDDAIRCYCR